MELPFAIIFTLILIATGISVKLYPFPDNSFDIIVSLLLSFELISIVIITIILCYQIIKYYIEKRKKK